MALGILNTMVVCLWHYLRYWWNETNFSSTRITFDRVYFTTFFAATFFILCFPDIDDCSPNPCLHGAGCKDGVNQFTCTCPDGYTGKSCETSKVLASCMKTCRYNHICALMYIFNGNDIPLAMLNIFVYHIEDYPNQFTEFPVLSVLCRTQLTFYR